MKPEQFIREFGVEKARELLNADSDFKTYCLIDKSFWGESEGTCSFCVDLDGVKRLVKSIEIINQAGGYEVVKTAISNYRASGDIVTFSSLEKRLKDHESIYGGGDE